MHEFFTFLFNVLLFMIAFWTVLVGVSLVLTLVITFVKAKVTKQDIVLRWK